MTLMPLALACQPIACMVWDESEDLQLSYDVAGTPFDTGTTGQPVITTGDHWLNKPLEPLVNQW
jgi:hypothetical protein